MTYQFLSGSTIDLGELSADELALVVRLRGEADRQKDWNAFDNFWAAEVAGFHDARGVSRIESSRSIPYQIGQDLSQRLAIRAGSARVPDYRDELDRLIRERFPSRRAFCQATGMSESLLSHLFHRRKDVAITSLELALTKVGCRLRIVPVEAEAAGVPAPLG